jgi:hypothetical protein
MNHQNLEEKYKFKSNLIEELIEDDYSYDRIKELIYMPSRILDQYFCSEIYDDEL